MTVAQIMIVLVLVAAMAMFLWGRWRHDVVAMGALLLCVLLGLVPADAAFGGFSHPAVITVASILVLGHGLQASGAMNGLAKRLLPAKSGPTLSILLLIGLAALLSAFMNNVGALALLMPIGIKMAQKLDLPAGKILMPLAFGSILGGMTTLIGTPPNLIVSGYRHHDGVVGFGMFDFAPVGLSVAVAGIFFIALLGWRLVPTRKQTGTASFETGNYLSEVRIVEGSKAEQKKLQEVERLLDDVGAQVVAFVRSEVRIVAPSPRLVLRSGDILILEVDPASLPAALDSLGLKLEAATSEDKLAKIAEKAAEQNSSPTEELVDDAEPTPTSNKIKLEDLTTQEVVVMPNAALVNRSVASIDLRTRFGISLLAISRQGQRNIRRLRTAPILAGDVLLVQGEPETLAVFAAQFGCLPLAERDIHLPKQSKAMLAIFIMGLAVLTTVFGLLPAAIAFAAGALLFVVLGVVSPQVIYNAIDWPVVVLLAAMLPIADAMVTTGMADLTARFLLEQLAHDQAVVALVVLLILTMFMSDIINNAATAAVMCPIAISTATQLNVNPDTFLMAIAIGASCAFLTPIGHQNNTLILGPGGFRFGDYWRMGLLLEVIVLLVSIPVLLWAWPL